jgi:hypothetical protein
MKGKENLQPIKSKVKARNLGKKGGIASGKAKRLKKSFKELFSTMLNQQANSEIMDNLLENFPELKKYNKKDLTNKMAVFAGLFNQAIRGNPKAIEVLRDTVGEKPVQNINLSGETTQNINQTQEKITDPATQKLANELIRKTSDT